MYGLYIQHTSHTLYLMAFYAWYPEYMTHQCLQLHITFDVIVRGVSWKLYLIALCVWLMITVSTRFQLSQLEYCKNSSNRIILIFDITCCMYGVFDTRMYGWWWEWQCQTASNCPSWNASRIAAMESSSSTHGIARPDSIMWKTCAYT